MEIPSPAEDDELGDISEVEFKETVQELIAASQGSKAHHRPSKELVNTIGRYAHDSGIPIPNLTAIVDLVTRPNQIEKSSITALIKNLYPATKIPSDIICNIVSSLGQGKHKPSAVTQNSLLRWLILTIPFLEDQTILQSLYSILFNLVDILGIRPNLCHLLALTTRRKHVKPFRIQKLLELSKSIGNESSLLGLLRVYQGHYPGIVVDRGGKAATFESLDPEWRERAHTIQYINVQSSTFRVIRQGVNASRAIVPEVLTYHSEESLALENINGVNDFIDKLEKIDLPDQMISILIDPLMQKYVMLRGIEIARTRVDQWLSLVFDSELQSLREGKPMTAKAVEILSKIPDFTRGTKNLPKSVESFLMLYLSFWDGKENRELILENISFLPMGFSLDLQSKGLNKLDIAMVDGTAESGTALLGCYTQLFRHSIARILTIPPNTYPASDLALLVEHISLLSLSLLVSYPASQTTLSAVLSYHEALAFAVSHAATHSHIRIITPLSHNIYLLTFYQSNISNLSRLCSVLATYKRTFESTLTNPPPLPIHEYPREYVNHFNGFLMDVCNLLWRSRAFNTSDTNALGCLLPQAALPHLQTYVRNLSPPQSLPTLFSLSFNPDFSAISIAAFRELEDKAVEGFTEPGIDTRHAGPVTQRSLSALAAEGGLTIGWVDYRLEVLKWLGERGVSGVGELMFCTMKHLMSQGKSQTPSKSRG